MDTASDMQVQPAAGMGTDLKDAGSFGSIMQLG